ncbi:PspC domain-containing protein [Pedobacter xixiisoli]|uniref:Phage shock protein C (PspC) family protein n=1 Tax=Pedobacter xixiisoli TaxID=1476464 RepID=A0A286AA20_9SPHI|nr:PspC domain-containing protein [Pedobacter xixiisoli]SOD18754.1 phage shock protein C (PspC) family protein [Pedobacter xixiisoli]
MEKKLYRNEHDKTVAGVASGLADYMQIDVTIVRLLFVLATIFLAGSGVIAYIILWIVAPVNNDPSVKYQKFKNYYQQFPQGGSVFNSPEAVSETAQQTQQTKWNTQNTDSFTKFNAPPVKNNDTGKTVVGLILLVLGVYFLLRQLDLVPYWFNIFKIYKLWPLAIVALGVSLIFKNRRKSEWENFKKTTEEAQRKAESTESFTEPTKETPPSSADTDEERNS